RGRLEGQTPDGGHRATRTPRSFCAELSSHYSGRSGSRPRTFLISTTRSVDMRKALVAGVALMAFSLPSGWALASASADNSGPSARAPPRNCRTGSKGRGGGGHDKGEVCGRPVGAPGTPSTPGAPSTPGGGGSAAAGRSVGVATPAAPVVALPRTTG